MKFRCSKCQQVVAVSLLSEPCPSCEAIMKAETQIITPITDKHAFHRITGLASPEGDVVGVQIARELECQLNHSRAEIAILKETHENQMDIIEKLHECRDVRRFEAIQMEIDGYLD